LAKEASDVENHREIGEFGEKTLLVFLFSQISPVSLLIESAPLPR
jgi:hypothetical protein